MDEPKTPEASYLEHERQRTQVLVNERVPGRWGAAFRGVRWLHRLTGWSVVIGMGCFMLAIFAGPIDRILVGILVMLGVALVLGGAICWYVLTILYAFILYTRFAQVGLGKLVVAIMALGFAGWLASMDDRLARFVGISAILIGTAISLDSLRKHDPLHQLEEIEKNKGRSKSFR